MTSTMTRRLSKAVMAATLLLLCGTAPLRAQSVAVMVNGEVIASDTPDNIRSNPAVQTAYLGDAHEH